MPETLDQSAPATEPASGSAAPSNRADEKSGADRKPEQEPEKKPKRKHLWRRLFGVLFLLAIVALVAARLALPSFLQWYVNRTIDQNPLYDGRIGDVDVHLWRGAYSIEDIRLNKVTGNVPVPLFAAKRVDLAIQWDALLEGTIVGRILIDHPELNFVATEDEEDSQSGGGGAGTGGPWLEIIQDLFPFKINRAQVVGGSVHLRAFDTKPPLDVYMSHLDATVENLTNVRDETTPLVSTVRATALAMDQAKFEYTMKFDPFSYRPSFQMATRLIGLDVTKVNQLARAYGSFDFERGFFDLVVEIDAKEGRLKGYVKPLFRDLKVLSLRQDIKEDNVVEFFWEALVGVATGVLTNPPRDQFGTNIPLKGEVDNPRFSLLEIIGNVLRNAFIRAYLPRLHGTVAQDINGLEFGRGSVTEPSSVGDD